MKKEEFKNLKGLWAILIIVVGIYVILTIPLLYFYFFSESPKESLGQFGDMFGVITSFFGSLTLAGVIYTIVLQRIELESTKMELKEQNTTTKIQRFENTFFKMIEAIENARENLKVVYRNGGIVTREDAFNVLYNSTKSCFLRRMGAP